MALVSHWKLDESAGNTTVADTNAVDAATTNGANTSAIAVGAGNGPGGSAADAGFTFGADADCVINIDSQSAAGLGNACTVGLAFKVTDPSTTDSQVLFETGGSTTGMGMFIAGGNLYFTRTYSSTPINASVTCPSDGAWHHATGYYNTTGTKIGIILDGGTASDEVTDAGLSATTVGGNAGGIGLHNGSCTAAVNNPIRLGGSIAWVKVWDSDESANAASEASEVGIGGGGADYELDQSAAAAITVADNNATLAVSREMTVTAAAALAVTDNDATLAVGRSLTVTAPAAIAVADNNATLATARQLTATAPAALSLTTLDADLTYNASGATYTLTQSAPAALSVAGLDASLAAARQIAAGAASESLATNNATLARSYPLTASEAGAISLATLNASLAASREIIAAAAALAITGRTATLSYSGAPDESTTIANGNVAAVKAPQNYQAALAPQNYAAAAAPQNWAAVKVSQ